MSRTSHRVLCEIDLPANNSWTLKEKLAMPEVRRALAKFTVSVCIVSFIFVLYWTTAMWVFRALHEYELQLVQLDFEETQNVTGCSGENANKHIAFDCKATSLLVKMRLQQKFVAFRRTWETLAHTTWQGRLLENAWACSDVDSACYNWFFYYGHTCGYLLSCLSFLSETFIIFSFLVAWFPRRYWAKVRSQLSMPTPEGVRFLELSEPEKAKQTEMLLSPVPPAVHTSTPPLPVHRLEKNQEEQKEAIVDDILGLAQLGDELNPLPPDTALTDGVRHRPVPKYKHKEKLAAAAPLFAPPSNAASPREEL